MGTNHRGNKREHTIDDAEHDAEACRMRARGMAYRDIAKQQGISVATAHARVQRALRATVQEPADDLREIELQRLDTLYQAAMTVLERHHVTVSNGRVVELDGQPIEDDAPVLAAIDRLVKVSESRRKLLGLDSPAKVDLSGGVKYELVGIDPDTLT